MSGVAGGVELAGGRLPERAAGVARPVWAERTKRALDVLGALVGLGVGAPLFVAVAAAVWLLDGRPVLFRWEVLGHGGRPFTGWKFRTMVREAALLQGQLARQNEMSGPVFKMRADPRVTRLGRFLRRYSLDELPQLWSVLKGDMSLVGPRPVYPHEWARFTPAQRRKLSVKPGLTCLWQVRGRSAIGDFEEWIRLDLAYIERWSLRLDLRILLWTVRVVLFGRGAW